MLEGIINTKPNENAVRGRVSTRAASPISTFERPYGPSSQVDIGLAARVDTRPRTAFSFGFVYVSPWLYQSRAVTKHRPETDAARVILWTIPISDLY